MSEPLCTHLIPEDQCLHCLSPALRVAIDALAQARAEITMLRAELDALRGSDPPFHTCSPSTLVSGLEKEIDALRADNERLRAAGIKARLALAHAEEKAPGLYIDYYNALDAALAAKG